MESYLERNTSLKPLTPDEINTLVQIMETRNEEVQINEQSLPPGLREKIKEFNIPVHTMRLSTGEPVDVIRLSDLKRARVETPESHLAPDASAGITSAEVAIRSAGVLEEVIQAFLLNIGADIRIQLKWADEEINLCRKLCLDNKDSIPTEMYENDVVPALKKIYNRAKQFKEMLRSDTERMEFIETKLSDEFATFQSAFAMLGDEIGSVDATLLGASRRDSRVRKNTAQVLHDLRVLYRSGLNLA